MALEELAGARISQLCLSGLGQLQSPAMLAKRAVFPVPLEDASFQQKNSALS